MPSAFDEAELLDRVGDDTEFLAETVQMLCDDGRALMAQLHTAIGAGDASAVTHAAHAMKGMISNFCAPATQETALSLERMGRNGDIADAATTARALDEQLNVLISQLQEFVKARSS